MNYVANLFLPVCSLCKVLNITLDINLKNSIALLTTNNKIYFYIIIKTRHYQKKGNISKYYANVL